MNKDVKKYLIEQNKLDFVKTLQVKDILEQKPIYKHNELMHKEGESCHGHEHLHSKIRTENERKCLIHFLNEKLRCIVRTKADCRELFREIVESLVDSRLLLKTYEPKGTVM